MAEIPQNSASQAAPQKSAHPLAYPLSFERLPFEESVKRGFVLFIGNGKEFVACTADGRYEFDIFRDAAGNFRIDERFPPKEREVFGGLNFLYCLRGSLEVRAGVYGNPPIPYECWKIVTFDTVAQHIEKDLAPAIQSMGRDEKYRANVTKILNQYYDDYPEAEEEVAPRKETDPVNVASNSKDWTEAALSNLAPAPFVLDGRRYESVEGFWQGLKFSDQAKRDEVAKMAGLPSKKIGDAATPAETFDYDGKTYRVGSPEHLGLMYRAIRAKLEQNPKALELLLATGNRPIIHRPMKKDGTPYPDSVTVPAETFSRMLTELRTVLAVK
jgi:predicted NAD-dependent protein-ADP-ribosyltransferase YbiA (DUF1768 family)